MDRRRREDRIAISLPVRVWGMDANQKPFNQTATTLDLTRAGVRIGGLECQLQSGDIVGVQHGAEKARFRVVWAGKRGGSQQGQAGLVCTEQGKYIWGAPLHLLTSAVKPPVAPRESRIDVPPAPKPEPETPQERRGDIRYAATGGVELSDLKGETRTWGVLTDLGTSGCYLEMTTPPKTGATVRLVLSVQGLDVRCTGEVRNSHLGVGAGISFLDMSAEDKHRLDELVKRIAAGVTVPFTPPTPKAAGPPAKVVDPRATALAAHTRNITSALRSMEDTLASSGVDFEKSVLREFRRTLDHTRENAWALHLWLADGADPKTVYRLLDELELKRMQSAIKLMKELSMDVDANALHLGTEGIGELTAAVEQLRKRLLALQRGDTAVVE